MQLSVAAQQVVSSCRRTKRRSVAITTTTTTLLHAYSHATIVTHRPHKVITMAQVGATPGPVGCSSFPEFSISAKPAVSLWIFFMHSLCRYSVVSLQRKILTFDTVWCPSGSCERRIRRRALTSKISLSSSRLPARGMLRDRRESPL